jgi:pimeloyl-ACP methyl ester carboxylesterase
LYGVPFRSLALVDVVALRPWGSQFFRLVAEHSDVFSMLPTNLDEVVLREYIAGASGPGLRPEVMDRLIAPWLDDGQSALYRQIAQADECFTAELEPCFAQNSVPTLIVWGTADTWIPVDRARRLADLIPGCELQLLEGAGHLLQEDAPAALTLAIYRWLNRHRQ